MKEKNNTVVFWGNNDVLSNFFVSEFKYRGLSFFSIEQCLAWKLSKLQCDNKLTNKVLKERNPVEVRKLMKTCSIKSSVANEHKLKFLKDIILAKSNSNSQFHDVLVGTENKLLVFASDRDFFLGSGVHYSLPNNYFENELRGSNIFGVALMQSRNSIKVA